MFTSPKREGNCFGYWPMPASDVHSFLISRRAYRSDSGARLPAGCLYSEYSPAFNNGLVSRHGSTEAEESTRQTFLV